MDCIFCKIVEGKIPCEKVFENDQILAFNDINPKALVHFLVIPKKHIESVKSLTEKDKDLIAELVLTAKGIAEKNNLKGYKLIMNVGKEGGQIVDHLHLHLLSGDVSILI
jgi:histidine triad (HIT) family protein